MRRLAGILAALGAAGALAGCGSSGGGGHADLAAFTQAVSATRGGGTARLSMAVSLQSQALPSGSVSITGDGVEDIAHRRGQFTFDMSSIATMAGKDPSQFRGEEIIDGNVIYMRFPFMAQALGAPWAKVDLKKASGAAGLDVTKLSQAQGDPTQLLGYLKSVSSGITRVGTDAVRGTQTTHYRAKIDLAKVSNQLPPSERPAAQAALAKMKQVLGTTTLPVDVWVDAQHRIRRMLLAMTVKAAGQTIHESVDLQLYDYGTPVSIVRPPASATRDLSTLGASGAGGFSSP